MPVCVGWVYNVIDSTFLNAFPSFFFFFPISFNFPQIYYIVVCNFRSIMTRNVLEETL